MQVIPYFAYELDVWDSEKCYTPMVADNIESLLKELENGANLFDLLGEVFTKKGLGDFIQKYELFMLKYGLFERARKIHYEREIFVSRKQSQQVGKLLIPYYHILHRDDLISSLNDPRCHPGDKKERRKALNEFFDAKTFYNKASFDNEASFDYKGINPNKILVLSEDQLR